MMKQRLSLLCLLAVLLCLCCLPGAQAEGGATLTLTPSAATGYGGDEITLSMALTAESLGGLQTTLTWNSGYLTYVEGSAAFSDAFASSAMTSMINDKTDGQLTLVYGNINGYQAENEVVFTARFLLTEDVSGDTTFTLTAAKATDASANLAPLTVETTSATVSTQIFDAGRMTMGVSLSNSSPRINQTFTVTLYLSSYTDTVGSMQGTFKYDPSVMRYVEGSAAFTEEASSAAMTKMINTATEGEVRFVYAAMNGFTGSDLITMDFEVIGGVNGSYPLKIEDLKATNISTDHLALMNTSAYSASLYPLGEPDTVYLTTSWNGVTYAYYGDVLTVAVKADGMAFGGLQATLNYNPAQLVYVPGSAAFTADFREGASITMVNDKTEGQLRMIYTNANGYKPDGSTIFTAQFKLTHIGRLDDTTLIDLKATNTGADLTTVPAKAQREGYLYGYKGSYDMSAAQWDYSGPFIWDGTEKTITITGLPEGLIPTYSGNTGTEPGSYSASVTFAYDSEHYYEPYMSGRSWTISKASYDMSNVAWEDTQVHIWDGTEKMAYLSGLPEGVTPVYTNNTATEPGTYYVSVTFEYDSAHYTKPSFSGTYWNIYMASYDMSGVMWDYTKPRIWDGTEKTVQLLNLPEGLTADYFGNTATEPGTYCASASFTYDIAHYNTPEVDDLTWEIIRLKDYDMSNAAWDYTGPFTWDGTEKTVSLTGLPEGITPVYTGNTAAEPGEYTASVTFEYDAENYYAPVFDSLNWQIGKVVYDLSGAAWNYPGPFTWDGTEKSVVLTGIPEGLAYTCTGTAATEPGEYTASVTFEYDEAHYEAPVVESLNWQINKAVFDLSGVQWSTPSAFVWDGMEKSVTLTGLPEGITPVYSGNTAIEPGEYTASVTFQYDEAHYEAPAAESLSWQISKIVLDTSGAVWNYPAAFTWDGTEKSVTLTGLPEGVTPVYTDNAKTEPGVYTASAALQYDEAHYEAAAVSPLTWEICKADYDLSGVSWDYSGPIIWDGAEHTVTLTGLPEGITPVYAGNTAADPGEYTASVTFEYDAAHYNEPVVEDLAWWLRKLDTYDLSNTRWVHASPYPWDGTEKVVTLAGLPDGLIPVYSGNAATEPGSYTASVTFQYDAENYYAPAFESLSWQIDKAVFDLSAAAWSVPSTFVWDGTEKSVTLTGLPEGLTPVYSGNTAAEPGAYTASVTFLYDEAHYKTPVVANLSWQIDKAAFDMSAAAWSVPSTFVWDGTEKSVTLSGLPEGVTPVYADNAATEPGAYTASVTFLYDEAHYETPVVASLSWQIDKAVYDLSAAAWSVPHTFTWDGTEKSVTLSGLPEGVTPVYTDNVKTEPGKYAATVTFLYDEAHYKTPAVSGLVWRINKAVYNMSGAAWDYTDAFTWDGTVKTVTLTGLPEGVTPVYTDNAKTEPGEYTALATFLYDEAHYEAPVPHSTTWQITPASYDLTNVSWDYAGPFIWDGTEKTLLLTGLPEGLTPVYSGNSATEPGVYTATVTFADYDDAHYYEPWFSGCDWEILRATYDLRQTSWDYPGEFIWDGTEKTVTLSGLPEGLTPVYTGNTATEPGFYTASVTFLYDAAHYNEPVMDSIAWQIRMLLSYDMTGVSWNYATPFAWNGTEKRVTLSGLPEGLTPVYSGNTATEPGKYTASVTFLYDTANYYEPVFESLSWQIDKLTFDMSNVTWDCISFIWDGTEKTTALVGLPEGLTPIYTGNTATDVGAYTATVVFEYDTAHYEEPAEQWTYWYINAPAAEELVLSDDHVILSMQAPWNQALVTVRFMPEGSAEEFLWDYADETVVTGTGYGGYLQALSVGNGWFSFRTDDERLSVTCQVDVVESFKTTRIPYGVTVLEEEAFCGASALELVILPETLTTLERRVFADSGLLYVQIPASVTNIAPDAFDGSRLQMIYAPAGSTAAQFAQQHGIYCVTY